MNRWRCSSNLLDFLFFGNVKVEMTKMKKMKSKAELVRAIGGKGQVRRM